MVALKIGGSRRIADFFEENVRVVPDKPFIRFSGTEFTYGDIGRESERLANILGEAGIGHQSRVALSLTGPRSLSPSSVFSVVEQRLSPKHAV